MIYRIFIFFISLIIFINCSGINNDERLTHVAEIVSDSPEDALASLDSIDYDKLSDSDRHYYDFLTIKAKDKAYIKHESDSLIINVIEYYSRNKSQNLYPEALYYGGRVYSDMGDKPSALRYFQKALDNLPADENNLKLKYTILSQMGRLLTSLRLYNEAVQCIKASLEIEKQRKDTVNIVYELQLLGGTYLRSGDYVSAENVLKESLNYCETLPHFHKAKTNMYLAAIKYYKGQLDSALYLIRNIPQEVRPRVRNSALGYAANIYLKAGISDSAYKCALELIHSSDSMHHNIGYQVILSPQLRKYVDLDTLMTYVGEYRDVIESYYDEAQSQLAIDQQSLYNYQVHERERDKAEKSNATLKNIIVGITFLILLLVVIMLIMKTRYKNKIIALHVALRNINELKHHLNINENNKEIEKEDLANDNNKLSETDFTAGSNNSSTAHYNRNSLVDLRKELREELYSMYMNTPFVLLSPVIEKSDAYQKLQEKIKNGSILREDDTLWDELEKTVIASSPDFKNNLQLLTGGKLSVVDLHTTLLIKCQIPPSQMSILLSRTKGTIVSRRESLCFRVFEEKLGTKVIDGIIRLL